MNVIFLLLLIFGSHLVVFRCLLLALMWAQGLMGLLGSDHVGRVQGKSLTMTGPLFYFS